MQGNSFYTSRRSRQRGSVRKGVLRNFAKFTGKYLCQSLCEISKSTFFTEHLRATASKQDIISWRVLMNYLIRS